MVFVAVGIIPGSCRNDLTIENRCRGWSEFNWLTDCLSWTVHSHWHALALSWGLRITGRRLFLNEVILRWACVIASYRVSLSESRFGQKKGIAMAKGKSESNRWMDVLFSWSIVQFLLLSQVVARRSPVSLSLAVEVVKRWHALEWADF